MSSFFGKSAETGIRRWQGQESEDGDDILQNSGMCGDNNSQSDGDENSPIYT